MNLISILLAQGFAAGFLYSFVAFAGVVLAMRYILRSGWWAGLAFGLGVAVVQAIWSAVAAVGMNAPDNFAGISSEDASIAGAVVLFIMAFKMFREADEIDEKNQPKGMRLWNAFGSGFLISIPFAIRILGYFGMFAGLGVHYTDAKITDEIFLVLGVVIGCLIWWAIFSAVIAKLRDKVTPKHLTILNKISAVLFVLLGILSLVPVFIK